MILPVIRKVNQIEDITWPRGKIRNFSSSGVTKLLTNLKQHESLFVASDYW